MQEGTQQHGSTKPDQDQAALAPSPEEQARQLREGVKRALENAGFKRVEVQGRMRGAVILYAYDNRDGRYAGAITAPEVSERLRGPGFGGLLASRAQAAEAPSLDGCFLEAASPSPGGQGQARAAAQPADQVRPAEEVAAFETAILHIKQQRLTLDAVREQLDRHGKKFGGNRELSLAITKVQESRHWLGECLKQYNFGISCYRKGNDPTTAEVEPEQDSVDPRLKAIVDKANTPVQEGSGQ